MGTQEQYRNSRTLLPTKRPLDQTPNPQDFYQTILKLIPDIALLSNQSIPVDKTETEKARVALVGLQDKIAHDVATNTAVISFVQSKTKRRKVKPSEYDPQNRTHKAYVINQWLIDHDMANMVQEEWSSDDIDMAVSIVDNDEFKSICYGKKPVSCQKIIRLAMETIAKRKEELINRNLNTEKFNPKSVKQLKDFFSFYGIKMDRVDRESLNELKQIILNELEARNENQG